jgi:hypothetical protein
VLIRTANLLIRSQMLYPIELRVRREGDNRERLGEVKAKQVAAGSADSAGSGGEGRDRWVQVENIGNTLGSIHR